MSLEYVLLLIVIVIAVGIELLVLSKHELRDHGGNPAEVVDPGKSEN